MTSLNNTNRLRRQSPFADGIQPTTNKYEPRRLLSTSAYRKLESYALFTCQNRSCSIGFTLFISEII